MERFVGPWADYRNPEPDALHFTKPTEPQRPSNQDLKEHAAGVGLAQAGMQARAVTYHNRVAKCTTIRHELRPMPSGKLANRPTLKFTGCGGQGEAEPAAVPCNDLLDGC